MLQYFGHLVTKANTLEKILMLAKTEGKMRWLDSITDSMDMNLTKPWEVVEDRGARHAEVHGVAKNRA